MNASVTDPEDDSSFAYRFLIKRLEHCCNRVSPTTNTGKKSLATKTDQYLYVVANVICFSSDHSEFHVMETYLDLLMEKQLEWENGFDT